MTTGGFRATVVYEAHGAMDFGTSCVRRGRRRCLKPAGRIHHIAMSAATVTGAVPMAHGCTVASTVQRASSHSTRMLRSKVTGRAGRRRGYERRGHDGRAQSCAAWAMPRPVERAPASDGADDREKRQSAFRFRFCNTWRCNEPAPAFEEALGVAVIVVVLPLLLADALALR